MTERFTSGEVVRILGITPKQLAYWERLGFAHPEARWGEKFYGFKDLISVRAVKQLTDQRVPARRLRRAMEVLREQLAEIKTPLTELRVLSNGRSVVVEHKGARMEPLSGQLVMNFTTGDLAVKVRTMPERGPEDWFTLALDLETDPGNRSKAIETYERVLQKRPDWIEPRLNVGALFYEQKQFKEAFHHFSEAVRLAPGNALAHFNLATVLDELSDLAGAHEHLREAVRLKPDYADAYYNLALVSGKLGLFAEARRHWRRFLELDPHSLWAKYARQELASLPR